MAAIPDGVYEVLDDSVRIFLSGSTDSQRRLIALLESARTSGATAEQVAEDIRTEVPELAAFASTVEAKTGLRLAEWILILLAVLTLAHTSGTAPSDAQIENAVTHAIERAGQAQRTTGRNEPCHCGSGRKYKHCHGSPSPPDRSASPSP
jgi:hypothetical protein